MAEENQTNPQPGVTPLAEVIEQEKTQQIGAASAESDKGKGSGRPRRRTRNARASGATGREMLEDVRERLQTLKQDTDAYVRKNPAKAVFTALGVGFVLGLIRRH